jgi:hypothetical protein
MATFILALLIIIVSLLGLALGVLFSRSPIAGSCGGLSCVTKSQCVGCTKNQTKRENHD